MNYLEITVSTTPAQIEDIAAALTQEGFSEFLMEDQQEFAHFLEENRAYWDYIDEGLQEKLQGLSQIKLYLEDTDAEGLSRLRALAEDMKLPLKVTALAETDWEESWKENYPPQPIGDKLIVLPYWLENADENRLPVILDPGLTFGTGAHPSTQMVMELMEEKVKPGAVCLDLGSGSGILSIAALRLGAVTAIGVDIDPKAEDIARENAAYNGFSSSEFTALTGNVTADKKLMTQLKKKHYDVVLVNIVADVICALAPTLPQFLTENSTLICSGILDTRLSDVQEALQRAGLTVTEIRQKEDWRALCAKRSKL
ncbi:MAG: 50S ribosomal protein L11 methyltransferase [Oscillospiraceae bacterium]|nr:50S ribosomal protein L11 methyltransferase [Oscillospiraceae bacterium]